jgi:hypothetical protein
MALWRTIDPKHPSVARYAEQRAARLQNRVADAIIAVTGSMLGFVYLHVIWFVPVAQGRAVQGCVPVRVAHDDRVLGSDLPEHVRDDQLEPRRRETAGPGRPPVGNDPSRGAAESGTAGPLDATHDADDRDSRPHDGGAPACEATGRVRGKDGWVLRTGGGPSRA